MAFYNRYDRAKRFAKLLFQGRQFVESAELNEVESLRDERERAIGDNTFGAISLRSGGTIIIDQEAGTVRISESVIWAGGYFLTVPERTLTAVPMVGTVVVGVAVTEAIITPGMDVSLKGIVPNTQSHGEPLSNRLRYDAIWALSGDPFYPVFTIIDGILQNEIAAPQDNSAELAVERHIVETHGSHISEGFDVLPGGYNAGTNEQTFIIGAGILRAYGRRVSRNQDQRYKRTENPTLVQVNGETHLYPAGGVVTLNNGPIAAVQTATVVKEVVQTITHQLAGGTDALPNTPVYSIELVNVGGTWNAGPRNFTGGTNYAVTTSWVKSGDGISWAPAGAEPAPGSTVTIVYRYIATVTPTAVGRNTITLEAAVLDQPVTVQYQYKLPRIDILAIDLDGAVVYLEGISSKYGAVPPPVAAPLAPLVRISNLWGINPIIEDIDQRKFTEAEVRALLRTLLDMQDRLSLVELERDIQERDPASRRGSFVDPFVSEDQRDLGIAQTAAIVDGLLQLPIVVTAMVVDIGVNAILLPYVTETVQSQPFRTLSRKINKYLNFAPIPSSLELKPSVDRWNVTNTSTISRSTSSMTRVNSYRPDLVGTSLYGTTSVSSSSSTSTRLKSRTIENVEFMRQIAVAFTLRSMGPGEQLSTLIFDGVDITASVTGTKTANSQGVMTGGFTVPPNIRSGTKSIVALGMAGSRGETSFTSQGTITTEVYIRTTTTRSVATTIDPVAQSFALEEMRQITGARVEFTARGNAANAVLLELRPMDGALPAVDAIAEGITPGTFALGNPNVVQDANWTEINFRFPALVNSGDFYTIALLTDDANHSVAVAQLGDQTDPTAARGFDVRRQEWIRRNPAGGDFFDGSNGVSWLVAPDTDLTYEIRAARYTSTTRTVVLGTFDLSTIDAGGISDLIVLLVVDTPSQDCKVRLELERATGEVISFEPNSRLQLEAFLTETVIIRMVLTGTTTLSPMVMPDCQILWGRLETTASYASEANDIDLTGGPVKLRTVIEANAPGTSTVTLEVGGPGTWDLQTGPLSTSLGDGWIEREYLEASYNVAAARTRIVLTGTPKDRPLVRKLRQRATEV